MMNATVIPKNTEVPTDWLDENGQIRLMSAAEIDEWPLASRILWCNQNARYGLLTTELAGWLKEIIGDRPAMEIGAGHGDICFHLGIKGTDSYVQRDNPIAVSMLEAQKRLTGSITALMGYGAHVEKLEAYAAVRKYRPTVVIGSWITEYWPPDKKPKPGVPANIFGVKEDKMLNWIDTYVLIGNLAIHRHKQIMKLPHEEYVFPWMRSRSSKPQEDRIWIWRK